MDRRDACPTEANYAHNSGELFGCHCWLVQQCKLVKTLLDKPAVALTNFKPFMVERVTDSSRNGFSRKRNLLREGRL